MLRWDPSLKAQTDTLENALAGIEETARDIRSYEEGLEYDPRELEEIESRLEIIHTLKKKYGASVAQVLEYQNNIETELSHLESAGVEESRLENDITKLKTEMGRQAYALSAARKKAAARFEKDVEAELGELNMSQVRFEVSIAQSQDDNGVPISKYGGMLPSQKTEPTKCSSWCPPIPVSR